MQETTMALNLKNGYRIFAREKPSFKDFDAFEEVKA